MPGIAAFAGPFDVAQAERLLWRAGFGPRRGEAEALAHLGLDGAVRALTFPGREQLVGPSPKDENGNPLAPYDAWGHDHVWWIDRMVRTSRPLVERMALVWHDWFATSDAGVDSQRLMLNQNQLLREHALGSFTELLRDVTRDPAMLLWLNGSDNSKSSPNENYGREMLELFTLGAGRGYTEADVRENARALTGFRNDWKRGVGSVNFRYDASEHDGTMKTIFKRRGAFNWKDSVRLATSHPSHASFFVQKLWSYFVPTPIDAATQRGLEHVYVASGRQIKPVVTAILKHPALHEGRAWSSRPRCSTPGCSAGSDVASTRPRTRGSDRWRDSDSSSRRTSRAGTTRAGSTPRRSADAGGSRRMSSSRTRSTRARQRSRSTHRPCSTAR